MGSAYERTANSSGVRRNLPDPPAQRPIRAWSLPPREHEPGLRPSPAAFPARLRHVRVPPAKKQKTHLTPANTLNVSQIRSSFVYV